MRFKILLWILALLLLALPAYGALTDDLISYYSFDTDLSDTVGSNPATEGSGSGTHLAGSDLCMVEGCRGFDGTNDFLELGQNTNEGNLTWNGTTNFTIAFWVRTNTTGSLLKLVDKSVAVPIEYYCWVDYLGDGDKTSRFKTYVNDYKQAYSSAKTMEVGAWNFLVAVKNNSGYDMRMYFNNTLGDNTANEAQARGCNASSPMSVGYASTIGGNYLKGYIDELGFWNRSLTGEEIDELWNNGVGMNPYSAPVVNPAITNFYARNFFNASAINTYNVSIANSTTIIRKGTTNGTIDFQLGNDTYNINYTEMPSFFNQSYINTVVNATGHFYGNVTQVAVDVTAQLVILNTSISVFNLTGGGTQNISTANGTATLRLSNGSRLVEINASGYVVDSTYVNLTSKTTAGVKFNLSLTNFTVYALFTSDNSTITNFNITITSLNHSWSLNKEASGGQVSFGLINDTYNATFNVSFSAANYADTNATVTMINLTQNYTFYALSYNSVTLTFYDEIQNTKIDWTKVSVDFISDAFANNYSSSNGSLTALALQPSGYTLRFSADTYPERFYYFTLIDNTATVLDLYMLNGTFADNLTVTVYDISNNRVEDAKIQLLKYYLDLNSYKTVEMAKTDTDGEARFNVEFLDEYYKFIISTGDVTRKITTPQYITDSTLPIQIVLEDVVGQIFFDVSHLIYSLTWSDGNKRFAFNYTDELGIVSQACLEVHRITVLNATVLTNSSCISNQPSNTLSVGAVNFSNAVYEARAIITYGENTYLVDTLLHRFKEGFLPTNETALFLVVLLTITLACTGLWNPVVASLITPIPILLTSIIGLTQISIGVATGLMVMGIIIAYIVADKS